MKSLIFILAIISTTHAITFNCSFEIRTVQIPLYSCQNAIVSKVDEGEILTAVYGRHMSGKTNNDVQFFYIYDAYHLPFFPRTENFFPNLEAIFIQQINITTLSGDEVAPFANLFFFRLDFSPLERIPGNFFDSNPLMQHIDFWMNNIKHIGANFLSNLPHLNILDFTNNYCVNSVASDSVAEIQSLIEHLRTNCTDIKPSCGDTNEIVCNLQEQIKEMKIEVTEIRTINEEMSEKLIELSHSNAQLSEENAQIKLKLDEVLKGIEELLARK